MLKCQHLLMNLIPSLGAHPPQKASDRAGHTELIEADPLDGSDEFRLHAVGFADHAALEQVKLILGVKLTLIVPGKTSRTRAAQAHISAIRESRQGNESARPRPFFVFLQREAKACSQRRPPTAMSTSVGGRHAARVCTIQAHLSGVTLLGPCPKPYTQDLRLMRITFPAPNKE